MYFQLQTSPTLALLHKRHAGVLLSFFQKAFRDSNIPEIPEERLEGRWETFIEEDVVVSDWEGETPTDTAKFYCSFSSERDTRIRATSSETRKVAPISEKESS